jgi:hypothetical protein
VKRLVAALAVLSVACAPSCGYRAVYGGADGERVHVVLARSVVADTIAAGEVVSGVREELAREGALSSGDGSTKAATRSPRDRRPGEGTFPSRGPPR